MKELVLLIALGVCGTAMAQTTGPTTRPEPEPLTEAQVLAQQLADADPAVQKAAWDKMQALLAAPAELDASGRAKPVVDPAWVRSLTKIKRYDDAEKLAITGITRRPFDPFAVSAFAKTRMAVLRSAGKHDAAMAAAKSAYLVCGLGESASVADSVNAAVLKVRPKDKAATEAFKGQQTDGAAPTADNLLKSIPADAAPYEAALKAVAGDDFAAHVSRGNLLLLMDRVADAKAEFEKALDGAKFEKEALAAFEGIAKTIRAETGGITAANTFMKEQLAKKPKEE